MLMTTSRADILDDPTRLAPVAAHHPTRSILSRSISACISKEEGQHHAGECLLRFKRDLRRSDFL